jgi:hypothetical protein
MEAEMARLKERGQQLEAKLAQVERMYDCLSLPTTNCPQTKILDKKLFSLIRSK